MKKVVFIADGENFSKGAFDFIKWLNETEQLLVVGIFYLSIDSRIFIPTALYPDPEPLAMLVEDERKNVQGTIELFKEDCKRNGIEYRLHDEGKLWDVIELAKKSRFSDLMVVSEEKFFRNWGTEQPNHFMRQLMHNAECPVMIIPANFTAIEKVLIAYDGNAEALFALKLFSMLFPSLASLETNIIFINEKESEEIPDLEYLEEYAARHFSKLNIEKVSFDPEKYLTDWIFFRKNALLVTGAFGRSGLSNLLKESFVEHIIKEHDVPVFIAHK
jgi:hypothetical protein